MRASVFWFVCFLFLAFESNAQMPFMVKSLTEADGLLSNYIQDLAWDGQQRLWIGTDKGLSMYDGKRFRHFTTLQGLSSSYVNKLYYHAPADAIVFSTSDNKYYAAYGQQIKPIIIPLGLSALNVGFANNGHLFFQGNDALGRSIIYFLMRRMDSVALSSPLVTLPQGLSNLRVLSANELGYYDKTLFDRTVINWQGKTKQLLPGPVNQPRSILTNTSGDTIQLIDQKFIWKNHNSSHYYNNNASKSSFIGGVFCTYQGKKAALITSYNSGELHFLIKDADYRYYNDAEMQMPPINKVLSTENGSILLATMGEGIKILSVNKGLQYFESQKVDRITGTREVVWAISKDELFFLKKEDALPTPTGIKVNQVTSVDVHENQLILTDLTRYFQYDISRFPKYSLKFKNELGNGISGYYALPNKHYLLSTYNQGVLKFNEMNKLVDEWNTSNGLVHDNIIEKIELLKNGFALTSYSQGAMLINNYYPAIKINAASGLISNAVYAVNSLHDSIGIGTEGGWHSYNKGVIHRWTYADGFTGKRAIFSFADKRGRVFVVSEKNLMIQEGNRLRTLQSWPVIPADAATLRSIYFDTLNQQLWCASSSGLLRLNVPDIEPDTNLVKARITGLLLKGKEVSSSNELLVLKAGEDGLVILIAINKWDFTDNAKIFYRLKGWHTEWLQVAHNFELRIPPLRMGFYPLEIYSENLDGYKGPVQTLITIKQLPPWYLNYLSLIVYAIILLFLIWQGVRYLARRKVKQKMADIKVAQQIQEERNRISHELHDNVGSQLTNIIAQLDFVETAMGHNRQDMALKKIEGLQAKARQAMNQLRESIWVLKEEAIRLNDFCFKVQRYALELFDEESGVVFELDNQADESLVLGPWQAVNLLRIIQEGCQNIQKHAQANKVRLLFKHVGNRLIVTLTDNGVGINSAEEKTEIGHGLAHMKHRANAIYGDLVFLSPETGGFNVEISLNMLVNPLK